MGEDYELPAYLKRALAEYHPKIKFRYSAQEWEAIRSTLPDGRDHDEIHLRQMLEFFADKLPGIRMRSPTNRQSAKAWRDVAAAASRLEKALAATRHGAVPLQFLWPKDKALQDEAEQFSEFLPKIAPEAERYATMYETADELKSPNRFVAPKPPNRADVDRDMYLALVVRRWLVLGGKLKTAVSQSGGASGPLIRFLTAAIGPAFDAAKRDRPGPHKLRSFVRKLRSRPSGHIW